MSAEILRRAAALMRSYASEATPGPWINRRGPGEHVHGYDMTLVADVASREDRRHIASWHPAVALAVAELLELIAANLAGDFPHGLDTYAEAVARAYLGSDA